jgi:hypothetical protein
MPERRDLSAREVHAILAAGLADPRRLDCWRRLRRTFINDATDAEFDVARIWLFSGLATKVRHNDLRSALPATFRILDSAQLSNELFAYYAPKAAELRNEGRNSKTVRIASLIEFLDCWLDREKPCHSVIWDIVRHESAIYHLRTGAAGQPASSDAREAREISARSVPLRSAGAIQLPMSCNPVDAVRAVRAGADPASVPREESTFAYCLLDDRVQVRIMAVDALASFLMDAADGSRTVAEMAERLRESGIELAPEDLIQPLSGLASAGLLQFSE